MTEFSRLISKQLLHKSIAYKTLRNKSFLWKSVFDIFNGVCYKPHAGGIRIKPEELFMAYTNRIFVGFAVEDQTSRDFLVGQALNKKSPFSFVDMSVKEPWTEQWKTNCRSKIKGCDGMIAIVSRNTANAGGALWEVACAKEEKIPVLGVYVDKSDKPIFLPAEFAGVKVVEWTWDNIAAFIDGL